MTRSEIGRILKLSEHSDEKPPYFLLGIGSHNNFYFSYLPSQWPVIEEAFREGCKIEYLSRMRRGRRVFEYIETVPEGVTEGREFTDFRHYDPALQRRPFGFEPRIV